MSPNEAKKILEALAEGVDPESGEVLPDDNIFNSPAVIRALYASVKALDYLAGREKRVREFPANAGTPWTESEEAQLLTLFDKGTSIAEIASTHGRTYGAIKSRLVLLGRLLESGRSDA